jgi:hypothetical protein
LLQLGICNTRQECSSRHIGSIAGMTLTTHVDSEVVPWWGLAPPGAREYGNRLRHVPVHNLGKGIAGMFRMSCFEAALHQDVGILLR